MKFLYGMRIWLVLAVVTTLAIAGCDGATQDNLQLQFNKSQAELAQLTQRLNQAEEQKQTVQGQLTEAQAQVTELAGRLEQAESIPTENVLYAFAPNKISVIDPTSARIVNEITEGLTDLDWSDAIVTNDNRFIFANERANAQVVVIDTQEQEIVNRIDVGPRPTHSYNPLHGDEIWTHSDEEGAFYVIDVNTQEVTDKVVAALNDTGHGKLRYHEALGDKSYATNTNDPAAFVIDRGLKEVIKTIELCATDEGTGGTHGKAYSPHSGHAYFECSRTGQTAVVDTATDTVLKYLDGRGQLFESPDDKLVVMVDKRNNQLNVIDATKDSEVVASIPVEGGPDKIYFYQESGKIFGFTANTQTNDTTVIDFEEMKVVKQIAAGDIARPDGAKRFHRGGLIGGDFFFTPAGGDGVVAIIDAKGLILHAAVPVEDVIRVAYVGSRS